MTYLYCEGAKYKFSKAFVLLKMKFSFYIYLLLDNPIFLLEQDGIICVLYPSTHPAIISDFFYPFNSWVFLFVCLLVFLLCCLRKKKLRYYEMIHVNCILLMHLEDLLSKKSSIADCHSFFITSTCLKVAIKFSCSSCAFVSQWFSMCYAWYIHL